MDQTTSKAAGLKRAKMAGFVLAIIGIAIWGLWTYADYKYPSSRAKCEDIDDGQARAHCKGGIWNIFFGNKDGV
jgi:hypothetical protein